jgi:hypothetical protein
MEKTAGVHEYRGVFREVDADDRRKVRAKPNRACRPCALGC